MKSILVFLVLNIFFRKSSCCLPTPGEVIVNVVEGVGTVVKAVGTVAQDVASTAVCSVGTYPELNCASAAADPKCSKPVPGIIEQYGYPVETHTVTTPDGYILTLFRIKHGKNNANCGTVCRQPVLLVHGFQCSSSQWLANTEDKLLALLLADACYDVWLVNFRGTKYSRTHVSLDPTTLPYWNFTIDDFIKQDFPTIIDHVMQVANCGKVSIVGYSMGTTVPLGYLSSVTGANDKVNIFIGYAPIIYVSNMKGALRPQLVAYAKLGDSAFSGSNGQYSGEGAQQDIEVLACGFGPLCGICAQVIFFQNGPDIKQLNVSRAACYAEIIPDTASIPVTQQFGQMVHSGEFRQFDRNFNGLNTQLSTPAYDMSKVTVPVALFSGPFDYLSVPEDVKQLVDELPNLIDHKQVDFLCFNHLDFAAAKDVVPLVFNPTMNILNNYRNQ